MLNSAQKAFALLAESIIEEDASPLPKLLGGGMAAKAITKFVHSKLSLSDKAEVKKLSAAPSWNSVKSHDSWIIIQGDAGIAAVKALRDNYTIGAVKLGNTDVKTFQGGQIVPLKNTIKEYVGKPKAYFAVSYGDSRWSNQGAYKNSVADLQNKRRQAKQGLNQTQGEVTIETLLKKFRPIFAKVVAASEADIQGMVSTMLKSGNYEGAELKIRKLKTLRDAGDVLSGDIDTSDYTGRSKKTNAEAFFKNRLARAVKEAVVHLYPNMFSSDEEPRSNEFEAAQKQLFIDLSNGDSKKLGALLWYLKNGFVR